MDLRAHHPHRRNARLTHAVTIDGPGADEFGARTGPAITSDIPDTMASIAKHAMPGSTI